MEICETFAPALETPVPPDRGAVGAVRIGLWADPSVWVYQLMLRQGRHWFFTTAWWPVNEAATWDAVTYTACLEAARNQAWHHVRTAAWYVEAAG